MKRFWDKVKKSVGCWLWTGSASNGYGRFWANGKTQYAHRFAYQSVVGPIPAEKVLDHLCRTPLCVNPAHLEVVTRRENTFRGVTEATKNAKKTHCPNGHEYTVENTYVYSGDKKRRCRECRRLRNQ